MYSLSYFLNGLAALDISTAGTRKATEILAAPVIPPDYDERTAELRAALAAAIADGKTAPAELERRAAEIDARRPAGPLRAAYTTAQGMRTEAARTELRRDQKALAGQLARVLAGYRAGIDTATRTVKAAGITPTEVNAAANAIKAGAAVAAALAERSALRDRLAELVTFHRDLEDVGFVPERPRPAKGVLTAMEAAARKALGKHAAEAMPGGAR